MDYYSTTEKTKRGFSFAIWAGSRIIYVSSRAYKTRIEAVRVAREVLDYVRPHAI